MKQALAALAMIWTAAVFGQEPAVDRSTIWVDAVKRGDLAVKVRGLGVLTPNMTADLKIPWSQANHVQLGQAASVDTRQGVVSGKVIRIDASVVNGMRMVEVKLEGDLPPGARPGLAVDGTIQITTLNDVVYVGRPVVGAPDSDGTLFKLEPDGQHVVRARVQYGMSSVNVIEVRSGLQPGDRVILSDMSAFAAQERLRLQ
jgi:HlyD family secretion protein